MIVIALFGLHLAALRGAAHPRAFPRAGDHLLGAVQRGPLHDPPRRDDPRGGGSDHGATAPRRPLESAHGAARRRDVVYSDQPNALANFHRRWVLFVKGRSRSSSTTFGSIDREEVVKGEPSLRRSTYFPRMSRIRRSISASLGDFSVRPRLVLSV